jgi:hypothetical protein
MTLPDMKHETVCWIRDILVRIRIRGTVPLTNRSGSGSPTLVFSEKMSVYSLYGTLFLICVGVEMHLHFAGVVK